MLDRAKKAAPVKLSDFLRNQSDILSIQVHAIRQMLPGISAAPRILTLTQFSEDNWGLSAVYPVTPNMYPNGSGAIRSLLTRSSYPEKPSVNVLLFVLQNPDQEKDFVTLGVLGNTAGDVMLVGHQAGIIWTRLSDDQELSSLLGMALSDNAPTEKFIIFREVVIDFLSQATKIEKKKLAPIADSLLVLTHTYALAPLQNLMEELHLSALHALQSSPDVLGEVQRALARAKKSHDKQYQRLLKDHEKLEMQITGYKNRIQRLEADLKKVGARQATPTPLEPGQDAQSLNQRLEALF